MINVYLLSLITIHSDSAAIILTNSSTMIAIVLAVIAILITLWDVSGQKQNVSDVKLEIESLKELISQTEKSTSGISDSVQRIINYQNNLYYTVAELQKLMQERKQKIEPSSEPNESIGQKDDDFDERLNKLIEQNKLVLDANPPKRDLSDFTEIIMQAVDNNQGISKDELWSRMRYLSNSYQEFEDMKYAYERLLNNGTLNEEDENIYLS